MKPTKKTSGNPSLAQPAVAVDYTPVKSPSPPAQYKAFPTALLPDAAAAIVRAGAASVGCDESFLALPALAALGSTIGNAREAVVKAGWVEPPIIWAMLIGPSGTAKTPAAHIVLAPLHDRHARLIAANERAAKAHAVERQRYDAKLAIWKRRPDSDPPDEPEPPRAERVMIEDTTIEALAPILRANPHVLLHRDELAGWIGSFDRYSQAAGGDVARWLSIFNAEPITVDRRGSGTTHVPRPAVSIIGGIQPGRLPAVLTRTLRDSGLLARLLIAAPPPKPKRFNAGGLDETAADGWQRLLSLLTSLEAAADDDGQPTPVPVRMSGTAQSAFGQWCDALNAETMNKPADTAAARCKLEAYAVRFALIFAVCESSHRIEAEHVHRGCGLADWFASEAERIYDAIGHNDSDRDAAELAAWIERRGGRATLHEITASGPRKYRGKHNEAEAVICRLADDGRGQWQHDAARGGRPTKRFVLAGTPGDGNETPSGEVVGVGIISISTAPGGEPETNHAA